MRPWPNPGGDRRPGRSACRGEHPDRCGGAGGYAWTSSPGTIPGRPGLTLPRAVNPDGRRTSGCDRCASRVDAQDSWSSPGPTARPAVRGWRRCGYRGHLVGAGTVWPAVSSLASVTSGCPRDGRSVAVPVTPRRPLSTFRSTFGNLHSCRPCRLLLWLPRGCRPWAAPAPPPVSCAKQVMSLSGQGRQRNA
jgi:hypothetical protein